MKRYKASGLLIVALAGCAPSLECGCPEIGSPSYVATSARALSFTTLGNVAAMSLYVTYGGTSGAKLSETDTCGSPGARVVDVSVLESDTFGEATALVTPVVSGACVLTFHVGNATSRVAVSVASAS